MKITVINGSDIAEVAAVAGSTIADVLDAIGTSSDGMQIKIGNEKKNLSCGVSEGDVIMLVPNVVAG